MASGKGGAGRVVRDGTFMIIGAVPSLEVPPFQLLTKWQAVKLVVLGHVDRFAGYAEALCAQSGVRSMNEVYPLGVSRHGEAL